MKTILFIGLITLAVIIAGCNTGDASSSTDGASSQEEIIELTQEEKIEIREAEQYCSALKDLDALDNWDDCLYGQLSWSTGSRYKQSVAQQEKQLIEEGILVKDENGNVEWAS